FRASLEYRTVKRRKRRAPVAALAARRRRAKHILSWVPDATRSNPFAFRSFLEHQGPISNTRPMAEDSKLRDPFREARNKDGVLRCPFQGESVPMILRHADVCEATKDWKTYSSDAPFRV